MRDIEDVPFVEFMYVVFTRMPGGVFLFYIYNRIYCPTGISPVGISCSFPRGKPAPTEVRYGACRMFLCFHNPPNSDRDYRIFNVHTDVNACDCTRGCTDTVRESALNVDCGRKIPCRTGESNQRQRRAGPMLYQLSYIPILP